MKNTEEVDGKGSWFPLLPSSAVACWDDRCELDERPILLDPTVRKDVDLIEVGPDGRMKASPFCVGSALVRVRRSIELYGLNLEKLHGARKRVMREVNDLHATLMSLLDIGTGHPLAADMLPLASQIDQIRQKTLPSSPYSKAARAQLHLLPGGQALCAQPEDGNWMAGASP